jgi:hypothetical protein
MGAIAIYVYVQSDIGLVGFGGEWAYYGGGALIKAVEAK